MCDALAAGDGAAAYATVDRVAEAGHDPRRFASDLLERLRDLIVLQQVPDAATKGLIDGPPDQIERMTAQAQRLGPATLSRCADIVHNGLVDMRGTTAPRLLLELICARMLLPGAEDSTTGLLQRLERMERRLTLGGGADLAVEAEPARRAPAPAPTAEPVRRASAPPPSAPAVPSPPTGPAPRAGSVPPPVAPAGGPGPAADVPPAPSGPSGFATAPTDEVRHEPVAARRPVSPAAVMPDPATPDPVVHPPAGGSLDAAAIRRAWSEIVAVVNRTSKPTAALMRDAVVRDVDGEVLVLTVKSAFHAQGLTKQADVLTDALYEEFGGRWQVRCEVAGDQRQTAAGGVPGRPRRARPGRPPAGRSGSPATRTGRRAATRARCRRSDRTGRRSAVRPRDRRALGRRRLARAGPPRRCRRGGPFRGDRRRRLADPGPAGRRWPERPDAGRRSGRSHRSRRFGGGGWSGRFERGHRSGRFDGGRLPERFGRGHRTGRLDGGGRFERGRRSGWPGGGRWCWWVDFGRRFGRFGCGERFGCRDLGQRPGRFGAGRRTGDRRGRGVGRRAVGGPGVPVGGGTTGGPGAAGGSAPGGAAATTPAGGGPRGGAGGRRAAGGGLAAARAAAAGAAAGKGRSGGAATTVADRDWAGEPPYDPEYDGPPTRGGAGSPGAVAAAGTASYEGFDPGDEPLDEVIDERTARQSSEQQAVQLLEQAFRAERIGEIEAT
ncbi:hypothetical protein GCM10027605_03790 [Micromonospora zhanjiangensis]